MKTIVSFGLAVALLAATSPSALVARPARPAALVPVENPLATDDQTEVMARALRLIQTPEVKRAREATIYMWNGVLKDELTDEARASFDSMMDDYTYNYALKVANSDANYPKVIHVQTPPRMWRGMQIPGSRWGGDNPDNVYRIIPVDGKARYRLDGRRIGTGPSDVTYSLMGNWEWMKNMGSIQGRNIPVNPDGTFSITIDPSPADGRTNHVQTRPGALFLFVRDSLGNWDQKPNALKITRLDPPDAPPMTDQRAAELTADTMTEGLPRVYWVVKLVHNKPNVMPAFERAGRSGGLLSQLNSSTGAELGDDDALVVTVDPVDAAYFSLVSQNYWYITIDYANHTSSLANGQVTRNGDGTVTYVVSRKDPGVHNWIDVAGLRYPALQMRLQGMPPSMPREPWIKSQLVKLADLKTLLPKETDWVTPAQRQAQVAERQRQIAARLADH